MASMLFFPGMHAACAYTSLVDKAIIYLPSLRLSHFPDANLERIASIADAVLEKSSACNLRPPSVFCAACTWPQQRSPSRSPTRRRQSPKRPEEAISLKSVPLKSSEVSISGPSESTSPQISEAAVKDPGEITFRPRRPKLPPVRIQDDIEASVPSPAARRPDTHQIACEFEDALLRQFGSLPVAFQFLDSATGTSTGQISATKFRYCWKALGMEGDMRSVFPYMDINGDGVIDEEEFKSWRALRQKQRGEYIQVSLPNSIP
jgi:hypothetical protein